MSKITKFSKMTLEEFLLLNRTKLHEDTVYMFEKAILEISLLKENCDALREDVNDLQEEVWGLKDGLDEYDD